jgi:hypothetical protein
MNPNIDHPRLTRLQRECNVSIGPALLLFAACAVLVLVLELTALPGETTPLQAGLSTAQAPGCAKAPPASIHAPGRCERPISASGRPSR